MKPLQIFLLLAFFFISEVLQAATKDVTPELLSYNLKTTVDAYNKAGRKNPKWDAEAIACLKAFAEIRSTTNGVPEGRLAELRTNLTTVMALKCEDPMPRYLYTRYILGAKQSAAELAPVFADVAAAIEKSDYPAIRKFYARLSVGSDASDARFRKTPVGIARKQPHVS